MLPTGDLAWMRSTQNAALPNSVTVYRGGGVDDGMGGSVGEPAPAGTYACRIAPSGNSPQERLIAQQNNVVLPYTITFPAGSDIRKADILKEDTGDQRTFDVIAPLHGSWETARRVMCSETLGDETGEV